MISLFTDGACKSNGKKGARGSYAYYFPDHTEWSGAFRIPDGEAQTNNRGELLAIYKGIEKAIEMVGSPLEHGIHIFTDSTYSRDCLTTWLAGWIRKGWKNSEGEDVKHRDLIEGSSQLLSQFKSFIVTHVRAHTGKQDELSKNNDIVDRMAVSVLEPQEIRIISTTDTVFPGLELRMMGSPLEYTKITDWCLQNLDVLDQQDLKTALFTAFHKTVHKRGYDLEIQNVKKSKFVRILSKTNIVDSNILINNK